MLNRLVQFFLYCSLLTPLVFSTNYIFPFISPKVIFFQTLVTLALLLLILTKNLNLKEFLKNKITILVFLFFLSLIISSVLGADVRRSFLGSYERSLGIINLIYFYLFFLVLGITLNKENFKYYLRFFLVVSNLVSLLGFFQYIGWPQENFFLTQAYGKVWSTLGNYIYLGSFSLFGIFFSLHFLFQEKNRNWKIFYLGSSVLSIGSLLMAASRGPFLGFITGLGFLLLIFFIKGSRRVKINMVSVLVFVVLVLGVSGHFKETKIIKGVPGLGRLSTETFKFKGTGEQRLIAWKSGLKAFKERPVFGWGNENIWIAFNKYYDPRVFELGGIYETNKDRYHNRYLDILVEQGLVGLLVWLILAGFIVYKLWIKKTYFLLALWLAYSSNLFFVFDSQSTYLALFLFLAYASSE